MMHDSHVWLVPENEEEERLFNVIKSKLTHPVQISVDYQSIKQLLKMDYIMLGKEPSGEAGICGAVFFNRHLLIDAHFQHEVILRNEYFKPCFRYLTRDIQLPKYSWIDIIFEAGKPAIIQIGSRVAVIAPYEGDLV